jgi:hypothetical protein
VGRKQRAPKYTIWSAVDTTTAPTSDGTGVKQLDTVLYEITVGASVNAILEVQGSTDDDNEPKTFSSIDFNQTLSLIGSTDTAYQVLIRDNPFNTIRLKLTNNGGTGNITAYVSGVAKGA